MEQQTISVAKAGIQATLNARAAILAAANPLGGRYDRSKPLKYNVNLPPAILSRFDLLHVMVDEVNPAVDEAIAYHILASHRGEENAAANNPPYTQLQLQQYIRYARALKPKLTAAVWSPCSLFVAYAQNKQHVLKRVMMACIAPVMGNSAQLVSPRNLGMMQC